MTLPTPPGVAPAASVPLAPPPPAAPVKFPLQWLLTHASPAIQYRSLVEVAKLPGIEVERLSAIRFSHRPALELATQQSLDGTWFGSMLTIPSGRAEHFEGVGTISAVRRLMEYGWDKDTPPLVHARRVLFRLLAEDEDPTFLFELATKGKPDVDLTRRGRAILREAAAAALAQAGYEGDPRLRGAAMRILGRIGDFLRGPLADKPWIRVGNQHVLAPEAAPPSIFALIMLAHMPLFRSEQWETVDGIYTHLTQTMPRQESVQLCGTKIVAQPHLVLGDQLPHRNAVEADVPAALMWLELMARLGFLRRNEGWTRLFERFLDDRDRTGVWHPHKGMAAPRTTDPHVWPTFPLEKTMAGDERWADVTFRVGLIARLAGRTIELV